MTGTVEEAFEQVHELRRAYALALHDAIFELEDAGRLEAAARLRQYLALMHVGRPAIRDERSKFVQRRDGITKVRSDAVRQRWANHRAIRALASVL